MSGDEQKKRPAVETGSKTVDFRTAGDTEAQAGDSKPVQRYVVGRVRSLAEQKESAAREVAQIITWTFAICAVGMLIGLYRILRLMPTEAKGLIADSAVPFLKELGVFLSSTFGPLLAFVLGYYFGEKRREDEKKPV